MRYSKYTSLIFVESLFRYWSAGETNPSSHTLCDSMMYSFGVECSHSRHSHLYNIHSLKKSGNGKVLQSQISPPLKRRAVDPSTLPTPPSQKTLTTTSTHTCNLVMRDFFNLRSRSKTKKKKKKKLRFYHKETTGATATGPLRRATQGAWRAGRVLQSVLLGILLLLELSDTELAGDCLNRNSVVPSVTHSEGKC